MEDDGPDERPFVGPREGEDLSKLLHRSALAARRPIGRAAGTAPALPQAVNTIIERASSANSLARNLDDT